MPQCTSHSIDLDGARGNLRLLASITFSGRPYVFLIPVLFKGFISVIIWYDQAAQGDHYRRQSPTFFLSDFEVFRYISHPQMSLPNGGHYVPDSLSVPYVLVHDDGLETYDTRPLQGLQITPAEFHLHVALEALPGPEKEA